MAERPTFCKYYVKPKWNRNSKISRPILAFRPRPITAHFFEVLNKTWMSACSDINQSKTSILAQQLTMNQHIFWHAVIDAGVWVTIIQLVDFCWRLDVTST